MDEYPKYVNGIIAQNEREESALLGNTAVVKETKSAQGSTHEVVAVAEAEAPKAEPEPKPAPKLEEKPKAKARKSKGGK